MKQVKLKVLDSSLEEVVGREFTIDLQDDASILDLINEIDVSRKGRFFIKDYPEYHSLLHMTWNPIRRSFYKQIAISAYTTSKQFFDVRKNPTAALPDGSTVFLGLGLCKSEHEEVVDSEIFQEAIRQKSLKRAQAEN